jgi:hypothetical protein
LSWPGGADCNSFCETRSQTQTASQAAFSPRHLTVVAFVIKAGEMEQTMQAENLNLFCSGVAETLGVLPRNVHGDGDVTREAVAQTVHRGKR